MNPLCTKILLLVAGLLLTIQLYAQQQRDVIYTQNGSEIRGKIEKIDTQYQKKDTIITYHIKIQGGTGLSYNAKEVLRVESEMTMDSLDFSHNPAIIQKEFHTTKAHKAYLQFSGSLIYPTILLRSFKKGVKFSTGYRISPKIAIGAGIGHNTIYGLTAFFLFPVYAEAQYHFLKKSHSPYIQLRVGHSFLDFDPINRFYDVRGKSGAFFNPELGFRFPSRNLLHFQLGIEYAFHGVFYSAKDRKNSSIYTFSNFGLFSLTLSLTL